MNPDRIRRQVMELEKMPPDYGVCYSDVEMLDEEGNPCGLYFSTLKKEKLEGDVFEAFLKKIISIPAPSIMFRRNVFETIGNFDERVSIEDVEMWVRLLPYFKVKYCDYVGVQYRTRYNTKLTTEQELNKNIQYHFDRVHIYFNLFKLITQLHKFLHLKAFINKKINYHLLQSMQHQSPHFKGLVIMLIKNGYTNIRFVNLLKYKIKGKLQTLKALPEALPN